MDTDGRERLKNLTALGNGLWELRRSGFLCDVKIVADGVTFLCHKAVLCSVSPYFTAMFTHDMKESRDSLVTLHEVKAELFETILESIYRGNDIVTMANVQDLMKIASLMQISTILEKCQSHFSKTLSFSNCVDIWLTAKKYNCDNLKEIVWTFMLKNFTKVCEGQEMAQLPLDTLTALLRDDNLNVENEVIVCEAAIKWLSADLEYRKEQGPDLLKSLRIPLCPPEYILQSLGHKDAFKIIQGSQEMLLDALVYHTCPARKDTFSAVSMTHRSTSSQTDVLVVIDRLCTSKETGFSMHCYSFLGRQWYRLPNLPKEIGPHYAMCAFGDEIYVSGGDDRCSAVFFRFQASTCTWISLPNMPRGRNHHAMAAVYDTIYTLGGENSCSTNIDGYQVRDTRWKAYGHLLRSVSPAVAAVLEQAIFVFGGNCEVSKHVQKFDAATNQVTIIDTMVLPGLGSRVVANNNVNYVITAEGKVLLTSDNMASVVGKMENFNEHNFGVTQYRGCFYIVPGSTASLRRPNISKVRVVNPVNLNIDETFSIPSRLYFLSDGPGLACCKISISRWHLGLPIRV